MVPVRKRLLNCQHFWQIDKYVLGTKHSYANQMYFLFILVSHTAMNKSEFSFVHQCEFLGVFFVFVCFVVVGVCVLCLVFSLENKNKLHPTPNYIYNIMYVR